MAKENSKKSFSLRRLIFNDRYLIITSLILAFVVWVGASLSLGETQSRDLTINTSISLNSKQAKRLGMQCYTNNKTLEIHVTVKASKFVINQVTSDKINVKCDISNVSRTGEQEVPIILSNGSDIDFDIDSYYPQNFVAYFDKNEERELDLNLNYESVKAAEGYILGEPVLNEDKIVVSGPKTYVDKVSMSNLTVIAPSDNNLTSTYSTNCNITLESNGDEIEENYLRFYTMSDSKTPITSVGVRIPVLQQVEVPISISLENKPKGIDENDIYTSYSTNYVKVGFADNAQTEELSIASIDFSKLKPGKNKFTFDTAKLNLHSVVFEKDEKIEVTVTVDDSDYVKKQIYIDRSDIETSGLANGKTAAVTSVNNESVTVYVPSDYSEDITLKAKCDLSKESSNGKYPISFTLNNSSSWVYGEYTADITIE